MQTSCANGGLEDLFLFQYLGNHSYISYFFRGVSATTNQFLYIFQRGRLNHQPVTDLKRPCFSFVLFRQALAALDMKLKAPSADQKSSCWLANDLTHVMFWKSYTDITASETWNHGSQSQIALIQVSELF